MSLEVVPTEYQYVFYDPVPERGIGIVLPGHKERKTDSSTVFVKHLHINTMEGFTIYRPQFLVTPLRPVEPTPYERYELEPRKKRSKAISALFLRPEVQGGDLDAMVGWLRSVTVRLKIRCPKKDIGKTLDTLKLVTGRDYASDDLDTSGSEGTWSSMYFVYLPHPPEGLELPRFVSQSKKNDKTFCEYQIKPTGLELDSREALVHLLKNGFDLGVNRPFVAE